MLGLLLRRPPPEPEAAAAVGPAGLRTLPPLEKLVPPPSALPPWPIPGPVLLPSGMLRLPIVHVPSGPLLVSDLGRRAPLLLLPGPLQTGAEELWVKSEAGGWHLPLGAVSPTLLCGLPPGSGLPTAGPLSFAWSREHSGPCGLVGGSTGTWTLPPRAFGSRS